jgi:HlyD family secretion protein
LKKRLIIIIFVGLLLGVSLLVYFGQRSTHLRELYYSGTIEAIKAELSFQISGRITSVLVDEGQSVEKGQLLAELDQSEFKARYNQTLADLDRSRKILQRLELVLEISRNTLPVEVVRAEAGVDALQSNLNELEAGYRKQDVKQAKLAFLASQVTMVEARKDKERHDRLFREGIISEKEKDVIDLRYEKTLKEYERAQERYELLKEGFREEAIQTAKARLAEGKAMLRQAKSNLKKIEAAEKDVDAARAQVKAAQASLELAGTQLKYTQLRAPSKGIITSRNVEPGEVVLPGRQVLSVSDLSTVDLKIFVNETEIGKVKPGQKVEVKVDSFPQKIFQGMVSFISPEGEFTPKIIQTHKERVKLVYLVKVSIPNPDLELKSGMPADAWLR